MRSVTGALFVVFGLSVAGCGSLPGGDLEPVVANKLTPAQSKALEDGIRNVLKDPASAQFSDFKSGTDSKGAIIACGWVNARNSFGGYTGRQPYLVTLPINGKVIVEAVGSGDMVNAVLNTCSRIGLPLSSL